jgi:hypothetical protein
MALPGGMMGGPNDDGITVLRSIAQILSALNQGFRGLRGAAGTSGVVTLAAAATTVVPNVTIIATSLVFLTPSNADAGTLVGSVESPFVDPALYVAGVSFTISCASGAASGTEIFRYQIVNLA